MHALMLVSVLVCTLVCSLCVGEFHHPEQCWAIIATNKWEKSEGRGVTVCKRRVRVGGQVTDTKRHDIWSQGVSES